MSTEIFNSIASRYDITNYVLSFGLDIGWRRKFKEHLPERNNLCILDEATGTGDVAIILASDTRVSQIIGVDPAQKMLEIAKAKIRRDLNNTKIKVLSGDALALSFSDASFDVVTVAFGVRNFPDVMTGLSEGFRVLKPNGRFLMLEFSKPDIFPQRFIHGFYLRWIMPMLGGLLTGEGKAYTYLSASVKDFPSGLRMERILRQTGFRHVSRRMLAMGAASLYIAEK